MLELIRAFWEVLMATVIDVLPIFSVVVLFQLFYLKSPIPNFPKVLLGLIFVLFGLSFFILGLEKALFPIGKIMANQLVTTVHMQSAMDVVGAGVDWKNYFWVYVFGAAIGFATTIAEPSLLAVAIKAHEVSGGTISKLGLRVVVALGVALSLAVGTYRIVSGTPLYLYIIVGYVIVIIQTIFAPKEMVALAYDSGGVTTSTVTVPIVAALGIGLSTHIEGRNPALDGFGLIAFASLFPIMAVLAYAQIMQLITYVIRK